MSWVIVFAVAAAYIAVTLWWARWLFGTWRARSIDNGGRSLPRAVEFFNEFDRSLFMGGAFGAALFWPLSLPVLTGARFVSRFMSGTPVRSQAEAAAERDVMASRISELERELGIREEQR